MNQELILFRTGWVTILGTLWTAVRLICSDLKQMLIFKKEFDLLLTGINKTLTGIKEIPECTGHYLFHILFMLKSNCNVQD